MWSSCHPKATEATIIYGHSIWDVYKLQFEMLATVNRWSNAEKATYPRAVSLQGPALTVLTNISPGNRGDYNVHLAALDKRLGSAHRTETGLGASTETGITLLSKQAVKQDGEGDLTIDLVCISDFLKAHLEEGASKTFQSLLEAIQGCTYNSTQMSIRKE